MNDNKITISFLVAALVLSGAALWASIPSTRSIEEFNDQGKKFFPEFEDPNAATSLEVVELDPTTSMPRQFKVELKNGRWVIPSHYDYPADAKDRLAKTAGRVVGLTKDTIRSSRSEDHRDLGVIDPTNAKLSTTDGVGKRITLRDKSNRILADYIIGSKEVKNHPDQKFVRRPDQARSYGVKLAAEPSTRFADWIETNLLKLESSRLRSIETNTTKVQDGQIHRGEIVDLHRKDAAAPWTTDGVAPGDEVDPTKMSAMVATLGDLKIAGVRPKPPGFAAALKASAGESAFKPDRAGLVSLARIGFYVHKGELLSDEGGLTATTEDGIEYVLKFGKVTFAQEEALSAGSAEESGADPKVAAEKAKSESSGESRFLFVTVMFRPELIAKPETLNPPVEGELPASVFQRSPEQIAADKSNIERDQKAYDLKLKEGKDRAAELSTRFAPWYYVVPGAAFRTLVMDRASLVHPKGPPAKTPRPGGFQMPGGGDPFGGFAPPG